MVPLTLAVASDFAGVPGQCIANIGSSRSTESSVSLVVASDESLEPQQQQKDLYVVLGLLWMVAAVSALDRVAMSVAIVSMAQEVSFLPETIKGSISSLFSVGYGLGIVPAGLLLSVASPRMVLAGGLALWSVATLLTPTAADSMMRVLLVVDNTGSSGGGDLAIMNPLALLWPVLLVRALVGVGESMVLPTFHRLLAVWTTSEQKGSGMNIHSFACV